MKHSVKGLAARHSGGRDTEKRTTEKRKPLRRKSLRNTESLRKSEFNVNVCVLH